MLRTQPPQSVPALQADAISRGVHAPASAWSFTCFSVTPKHEQTYTRVHLPDGIADDGDHPEAASAASVRQS